MKNFHFIFLFFGLLLALASCMPKPITQTSTSETTTVDVKTVARDTIFKIDKSNAQLIASIEALKNAKQPTVYKQDRSTVKIEYRNDTIYAECQCDSVAIKAQLFDKYINTLVERETETTITKFKRQSILKQLGIIALIIMILAFIGAFLYVIKKVIFI